MPKISVITPTYNRADVLPRALKSVQRQTFQDYEHIVVDDGSSDDTEQIVSDHAHDRLRYHKLEQNRGPAAALNHGVTVARGKYISILDSDDRYVPERLEVTNRVLDAQPPRVGGVFHGAYRVDGTKSGTVRDTQTGGVHTESDFAAANVIRGHPNTIYRSSVFEQVGGYDETLESVIDYDFQLRAARQFDWFGIPDPLVIVDDGVDGIQSSPAKIRRGVERFLDKHEDTLETAQTARMYRQVGKACLELGDEQGARAAFERSIDVRAARDRPKAHYLAGRAYLRYGFGWRARSHLTESARKGTVDFKNAVLLLVSVLPVSSERSFETLKHIQETLPDLTGP